MGSNTIQQIGWGHGQEVWHSYISVIRSRLSKTVVSLRCVMFCPLNRCTASGLWFQATSECSQKYERRLQNTPVPFVWYKTPADETVIDADCKQQNDMKIAAKSAVHNVLDNEMVDTKEDDDALCSPLSRHSNDVDLRMLRGACVLENVQEVDVVECKCSSHIPAQLASKYNSRRTRTAKKTYECDVCLKTFSSRTRLTTRKHIHSGSKPYLCKTCNRTFGDIRNLTMHKHIYTGYKP